MELCLVKPQPVADDSTDPRWKWFKGYLGALDGTYIPVMVPNVDKPRSQLMEPNADEFSVVPDYRCSRGKMLLKCAGQDAGNPGRYYYKCPSNVKHEKWFLWADEFHQKDPLHRVPKFVLNQQYAPNPGASSTHSSTHHSPDVNSVPLIRPRLRNDLELQVAFIFMSSVLVLLGVLLGKLL